MTLRLEKGGTGVKRQEGESWGNTGASSQLNSVQEGRWPGQSLRVLQKPKVVLLPLSPVPRTLIDAPSQAHVKVLEAPSTKDVVVLHKGTHSPTAQDMECPHAGIQTAFLCHHPRLAFALSLLGQASRGSCFNPMQSEQPHA